MLLEYFFWNNILGIIFGAGGYAIDFAIFRNNFQAFPAKNMLGFGAAVGKPDSILIFFHMSFLDSQPKYCNHRLGCGRAVPKIT